MVPSPFPSLTNGFGWTDPTAMPDRLPLLGRTPITYSSAIRKNYNVLRELDYVTAIKKQYTDLWAQRESIEALVRYHLRLGNEHVCTVLNPQEWIQGAFNICVLVEVASSAGLTTKFVFRCPKPHRLVGIVDEKMSSEVGAYVWVQEKCRDVRVPHLFGFGFSDGRQFTHVARRPFYIRILHALRRSVYSLFQLPILSQYTNATTAPSIRTSYMLLEHIGSETGQMLSTTLDKHKSDPGRRQRLFHGMSRIMLSLARIPQPHIGSFRFHDDGTISLTNRYLSCSLAILENEGAPRSISRNDLHTCTDSFVSDLVTFHDGRFLAQPNAAFSENDCRGQMATMSLLRAISHRYIKREYRRGPYLLKLTDVNPSNIFVDQDWNVKCLIDLEWICALPVEMMDVPYWLTGCSIENIQGEEYDKYDKVRQEFMSILEKEEDEAMMEHGISIPKIMKEMWDSKGVWFWHCLTSVDAMDFLLEDHLCPSACLSSEVERAVSEFWCDDASHVVEMKLADKAKYDDLLKSRFG
ncbi:hypothetical protein CEP52_016812 [Fusarium oligoseptatum]|uniref:Aminoglycoside phosphotransferase domain-containing protein n=2 Tax=Fusarium solani species complex TaxID=232080 RepID=A0A428RZR1_9HYPO|nr:hypothetical protein CEP51_014381 [Fusarium floridanum]RSL83061.1 hypothetical protein CEP52_016812 [Fusarium oligoseptatum]